MPGWGISHVWHRQSNIIGIQTSSYLIPTTFYTNREMPLCWPVGQHDAQILAKQVMLVKYGFAMVILFFVRLQQRLKVVLQWAI